MDELTVESAVRRDLEAIAELDPDLAQSALAASALALARSIDHERTSATARSMCARSLIDTLDHLYERAPEKPQEDSRLDELRARRASRLEGKTRTAS